MQLKEACARQLETIHMVFIWYYASYNSAIQRSYDHTIYCLEKIYRPQKYLPSATFINLRRVLAYRIRGHSMTTWTQFCPFDHLPPHTWTILILKVDKEGHFWTTYPFISTQSLNVPYPNPPNRDILSRSTALSFNFPVSVRTSLVGPQLQLHFFECVHSFCLSAI